MHSRRALLYVPGNERKKIDKAVTLKVDAICLDMEDGVSINKKESARETIIQAMKELDFGTSERCIRINGIGSGFENDDLDAALAADPDTLVLPKVESPEHIQWISAEIKSYELAHNLPVGSIRLLIGVETARGVMNIKDIAGADNRLDAITFGAEDFAASIGATRSRESTEVLYARSVVVTACAANELLSIDMVAIDFKDLDSLKVESTQGAAMGFSGKQIIHPNQVGPVQDAFTPSDDAIAYAQRVVETFEASQSAGRGAYALDGKMIDMPLLRGAQNVLARAKAAGKL